MNGMKKNKTKQSKSIFNGVACNRSALGQVISRVEASHQLGCGSSSCDAVESMVASNGAVVLVSRLLSAQ